MVYRTVIIVPNTPDRQQEKNPGKSRDNMFYCMATDIQNMINISIKIFHQFGGKI